MEKNEPVQLYVWNLANAQGDEYDWARQAKSYKYKPYHSSVVLFNTEYSFSTDGICTNGNVTASIHSYGEPEKVEYMGCTEKTKEQLNNFIDTRLRERYLKYDLVGRNCNHFAEDLLQYLVQKILPKYVTESLRETHDGWGAWFASKFTSNSQESKQGSQCNCNNNKVEIHLPSFK